MVKVRVLRNQDVRAVAAFIPPGHRHVRIMIDIGDEVIFLQQATVDALLRAYASVALHPCRRAIKLVLKQLGKHERKEGFAEYQLIESDIEESEVLRELCDLYYGSDETHATD